MAKRLISSLIEPVTLRLLLKSFVLTLPLFLVWLFNFPLWFLILTFIFFISFYLFSGHLLKKIRFSFWLIIFLALIILSLPSVLSFSDSGILLIDKPAAKIFFAFQDHWLVPSDLKIFLIFIFFVLFFIFLKAGAGNFNFLIYSAGQFILLVLTALLWFYLISFAASGFVLFFLSFFLFLSVFLIFNEAFLNEGSLEVDKSLPLNEINKGANDEVLQRLGGKWRLRIAALAIGLISLELAWFLTLLPLSFFNAAGLLVLVLFLLREEFIAYFKNKFNPRLAVFLLTIFIIFILIIFLTSQWSV